MRRRTTVVAAAVAIAIALAMIALPAAAAPGSLTADTGLSAPAFPPERPTRVLVLGDSVMAGAASQYGPALPGRDVTVDAMVNRTTGQGAAVVAQRGTDWDVVVVMLGHNDGSSPGVYQPAANRILDQLANVPRVVWLNLHEVRPYYRDVNAFLRAQASRRPNLRIADWNAVANAHPEGLAGDGLHLNGRGGSLMAGIVAQQVEAAEGEVTASGAAAEEEASRQAEAQANLLRAKAAHDAAQAKLLETIAQDNAKAELLRAIAADNVRTQVEADQARTEAAARARVAEQQAADARAKASATTVPRRTVSRNGTRVSDEATGPTDVVVKPRADRPSANSGGAWWLAIIGLTAVGLFAVAAVLVRRRPRRAR